MARPREPYRIAKHKRKDKKTNKTIESLKWNIYFRDHLQIERKFTGTSDKSTTEYIARNITAVVNLKSSNQPLPSDLRDFIESQPEKLREGLFKWGILDANTNAAFEPLLGYTKVKAKNSKRMIFDVTGGHVFNWQKSMEDKAYSAHHISESIAKVVRIITGCGFIVPSDINEVKVQNWMAKTKDKKSVGVANGHLKTLKVFCRWMLKTNRISHNPLQYLQPLKNTDRVRPRRALTKGKVDRLITATINADKHHGLTGYERSLVYRLALRAGLRYNEIYTLERKDITFGTKPKVTVKASNAKNRKEQPVPLFPELAKELEQYFTDNPAMPHTKAFSGMWKDAGAEMLRPDLELAGIEYETEDGFADFHNLRHTCGTMLTKAGVHPKIVQEIMRHSNINLTMGTYTHLQDSDKAEAISKLPPIKILKPKQAKTGTCDTPENLTANLTENPVKTQRNSIKFGKGEIGKEKSLQNVKSCKNNSLSNQKQMRALGLEPRTYGLKGRCSTKLSYTPKS